MATKLVRHSADTYELRAAFAEEFLSGPADPEVGDLGELTIGELLEEHGSRLEVLHRRGLMPREDVDFQYEDAEIWLSDRGYTE